MQLRQPVPRCVSAMCTVGTSVLGPAPSNRWGGQAVARQIIILCHMLCQQGEVNEGVLSHFVQITIFCYSKNYQLDTIGIMLLVRSVREIFLSENGNCFDIK